MLCDLNEIVAALAQLYPVEVVGSVEVPIRFIKRLKADEPIDLKPETLYVGTPADLSNLPVDQDLTSFPVLCVQEMQTNSCRMQPTSMRTLVYIYQQKLDEVLMRLLEIFFDLGQRCSPMSVLYQRLLQCRTIDAMLSCAAEEIHVPVMLVDNQHRITHSAATQKTSMAITRLQNACAFYPNIATLPGYDSELLEYDFKPERESFHISVLCFDNTYLFFFDVLDAQGRMHGKLLVFSHTRQLPQQTMDDCLLLLRFIAMSVHGEHTQAESETVEDFLLAVFHAELPDASTFAQITARFGWKLKPNLYVLIFSNGGQLSGVAFRDSLQYYLSLLPGSHGFLYHGQVILIYDAVSVLASAETPVLSELLSALRSHGQQCGISGVFHSLTELKHRYLQALQALHFGSLMQSTAIIHFYEDCAVYRLAELASIHENLRDLISDGFSRLVLWDKTYKTELVKTLEAYLLHRGNVANCARTLRFHVNTIKYRLGKIEEITGCSLSDGESYFKLALSMKIFRYLQQNEPSQPPVN